MRLALLCLLTTAHISLSVRTASGDDLIAHWTFDGDAEGTCVDSSGNKYNALARGEVNRVPGVLGTAIGFSGGHSVSCAGKPDFSGLKEITLSAWAMPSRFERYNEIFRKDDGNSRVLFSFQEHGSILSLGLNIGGYVECDAPIDPAKVADGQWHHCAATFDGRIMRVYLDGKQVGSLARTGAITAGGGAPGCIGSTNDREHFQGAMDDLRIYCRALTPEEVVGLAKWDAEELAGKAKATARAVAALPPGRPAPKRAPQGKPAPLTPAQQVDAMCEYLPLTEGQWANLPAEEAGKWREVVDIKRAFEQLSALDPEKKAVDKWSALVARIKAMDVIHERPRQREAVAPRVVKPVTPETRRLSDAEALSALHRDWLHQASGKPTVERVGSEIAWARELAARIGGPFEKELAQLAALEKESTRPGAVARDLYMRVREVKRSIMFRNPVVDFDEVVFVDMPLPGGGERNHETRHRLGYMAVPGARLLTLKGLSPAGELKQLMPQAPLHGAFWRPDVSWDGDKVLFCFQPHNEKSYHLYEIMADGTGLRQLTFGPYDDLDPIYLPDGKHILFSSTRGHTYVRCMPPTSAFVLTRCDTDGKNIYIISRNNEPDYLPSVMNDGRVVYTRWEYTDKPLWRAQGLWTVNPDGREVNTLWGNQSVWPDLLKDARSIPGSHRVMFTGSAHHNWFAGSVGIIDPAKGFNFPDGIAKVTKDVEWPESRNGPTDPIESPTYHSSGRYDAYYSPYPLGERDFLVSANRGGKFMLYLMDVDGNRELIYEGHHNIFHAMPLKPRPIPPVRPDMVAWPTPEERLKPKHGILFSNNVYEGVPEKLKGKAAYLRVLSIDAKTYTYWHKRPYLSTGPVVSGVQSEGVKRILGTVPVEKDGSVAFKVPSGIPLHFQLLDAQYRALQTMRSFTGVMPGERRGCVGCHELRRTAPGNETGQAAAKPPCEITPPPWGEDTVSWDRYVRPVLDRYCAECHQGEGKGRKAVDMRPRPGHLGFDETYWLFTGKPAWGKAYKMPENPPPGWGIADMIMVEGYHQRDPDAYKTPDPMTHLSYRSRLVEIASSGKHPPLPPGAPAALHATVKVDEISRRRLIAWVDAMCPYRGDKEVREIEDPVFQGVDWLAVRPRIKTAPRIIRPGPLD
jgi:hypothetical protein